MANSYIIYPADGVQTDWTVALAGGFLSRDDVFVQVITGGVPASQSFTWLSDTLIRITPAVASGKEVKIYRDTPKVVPLVDFSDGSIINEQNLDSSARQTLLAVAELADQTTDTALTAAIAIGSVATSESALIAAEAALIEAEAAVAAVDGANTAASLATAAASAATTAADSATVAANNATATSANAAAISSAAEATANGIAATANSALTEANSAVTTANAAQATAASAEATANGIAGTANTALTNANAAVVTADAALVVAASPVEKIGESATASQNFTITAEAADGTMKLARGNAGATTQDILTVNSGGVVKMPQNVVAFRGYSDTNQTGLSSGTWTRVVLTDTEFDTNSALTLNTAKFQPTVAGYYQVSANITAGGAGIAAAGSIITKNHPGGAINTAYAVLYAATSVGAATVSGTIYLNGTTDYIELWGSINGTSGLYFVGTAGGHGVNISGHLLGAT